MIILKHNNRILKHNNRILVNNRLLLDEFSNVATAYSVRKLYSKYSGYSMRVYRALDAVEMNIGFDLFGNLDTTTLLSFAGSDTLYVVKWYDQSGNNNHAISTASNSMVIVASGVLIVRNNKPAIICAGINSKLSFSSINLGTAYSAVGCMNFSQGNCEWLGGGISTYGIYVDNFVNLYWSALNNNYFTSGVSNTTANTKSILEIHRTDLQLDCFGNNVNNNVTKVNNNNTSFIIYSLNGESIGSYNLVGTLQETIIFSTNKLAQRGELYKSINNYFS